MSHFELFYFLTQFLLPWVVGGLVLILGAITLFRERASAVSIAFLCVVLSVTIWLVGYAKHFLVFDEVGLLTWARFSLVGVCFIPSSVLAFALGVVQGFQRRRAYVWLAVAFSSIFAFLLFVPGLMIDGFHNYSWGYYSQFAKLFTLFIIFFFLVMCSSLLLFWSGYLKSLPGIHKKRLRFFLIATCIAYMGSIDFLPGYGIDVAPFGYLPIFCFVLLSAWAINRYRLEDVTTSLAVGEVLDTLPDAFLVLDHEGVVRVANQAAYQLFAYHHPEILGKQINKIEKNFLNPEIHRSLLNGKSERVYEFELYDAKHEPRTFNISASVIRGKEKKELVIILVARDVTQREQEQKELEQANAHLNKALAELKSYQSQMVDAEKMAIVGQLAGGVAHEVKNPLTIISLASEYIKKNKERPGFDVEQAIAKIMKATSRANTIVNDLLDFSRSRTLDFETGDLNEVVEKAVALIAHYLDIRDIKLQTNFHKGKLKVEISPNRVMQVLVNIMRNAIDASPTKSTIRINTRLVDLTKEEEGVGTHRNDVFQLGAKAAVIEIEDEGLGISDEHLKRVFDPFFTTKDPGMGTGMGLSIVRSIMRMHHGLVKIENLKHGGARVRLLFKT
jgi:PAS domain S-box-containing protein